MICRHLTRSRQTRSPVPSSLFGTRAGKGLGRGGLFCLLLRLPTVSLQFPKIGGTKNTRGKLQLLEGTCSSEARCGQISKGKKMLSRQGQLHGDRASTEAGSACRWGPSMELRGGGEESEHRWVGRVRRSCCCRVPRLCRDPRDTYSQCTPMMGVSLIDWTG